MTTSSPENPDSIAPATSSRSVPASRDTLRERALDLSALVVLLIVTAVLYLLFGSSAYVVTVTAVSLYTTYRFKGAPPAYRKHDAEETCKRDGPQDPT